MEADFNKGNSFNKVRFVQGQIIIGHSEEMGRKE